MHAYAYDAIAYKFTGKERDSETGLDNFGARYDSSSLGRFMTPDWAERPTTVPYAVFGDPQSLNLYGYVRNDPVSRADADGHCGPGEAYNQQENTRCNTGSNPGSPDNTKPTAQNQPQLTPAQIRQLADQMTGAGKFDWKSVALVLAGGKVASLLGNEAGAIEKSAASAKGAQNAVAEGSFSVSDWSGYPSGVPKPTGPVRLIEGAEYNSARAAANSTNRALRAANPAEYAGKQIHEIQPVKFGGSPTDMANKVALSPVVHSQVTNWWNGLMRTLMETF